MSATAIDHTSLKAQGWKFDHEVGNGNAFEEVYTKDGIKIIYKWGGRTPWYGVTAIQVGGKWYTGMRESPTATMENLDAEIANYKLQTPQP